MPLGEPTNFSPPVAASLDTWQGYHQPTKAGAPSPPSILQNGRGRITSFRHHLGSKIGTQAVQDAPRRQEMQSPQPDLPPQQVQSESLSGEADQKVLNHHNNVFNSMEESANDLLNERFVKGLGPISRTPPLPIAPTMQIPTPVKGAKGDARQAPRWAPQPAAPTDGSSEKPAMKWSSDEVVSWLLSLDPRFGRYGSAFKENEISGSDLLQLSRDDLKEDLGIKSLGDRKRMLAAIQSLRGCRPSHNHGPHAPVARRRPNAPRPAAANNPRGRQSENHRGSPSSNGNGERSLASPSWGANCSPSSDNGSSPPSRTSRSPRTPFNSWSEATRAIHGAPAPHQLNMTPVDDRIRRHPNPMAPSFQQGQLDPAKLFAMDPANPYRNLASLQLPQATGNGRTRTPSPNSQSHHELDAGCEHIYNSLVDGDSTGSERHAGSAKQPQKALAASLPVPEIDIHTAWTRPARGEWKAVDPEPKKAARGQSPWGGSSPWDMSGAFNKFSGSSDANKRVIGRKSNGNNYIYNGNNNGNMRSQFKCFGKDANANNYHTDVFHQGQQRHGGNGYKAKKNHLPPTKFSDDPRLAKVQRQIVDFVRYAPHGQDVPHTRIHQSLKIEYRKFGFERFTDLLRTVPYIELEFIPHGIARYILQSPELPLEENEEYRDLCSYVFYNNYDRVNGEGVKKARYVEVNNGVVKALKEFIIPRCTRILFPSGTYCQLKCRYNKVAQAIVSVTHVEPIRMTGKVWVGDARYVVCEGKRPELIPTPTCLTYRDDRIFNDPGRPNPGLVIDRNENFLHPPKGLPVQFSQRVFIDEWFLENLMRKHHINVLEIRNKRRLSPHGHFKILVYDIKVLKQQQQPQHPEPAVSMASEPQQPMPMMATLPPQSANAHPFSMGISAWTLHKTSLQAI